MKWRAHKISFCVTCMNRLHHLKETLLKNIKDNEDYANLEFVLLDYSSQDGLDEWTRKTLWEYIDRGKLIYYKMHDLDFFNHSHAKNVALKLGTGDIVCSINADHYLGEGFASYINKIFNESVRSVITPIPKIYYEAKKSHPPSGSWGKVCVRKEDFIAIKGFDESMIKYGNDDIDLINRLEMYGVKRYRLKKPEYCSVISHDNEERYSSKKKLNNVYKVYIKYFHPSRSEIIYLFQDGRFERFVLEDEAEARAANYLTACLERKYRYRYTIENFLWEEGRWSEAGAHLIFTSGSGNEQKISQRIFTRDLGFHEIVNPGLIEELSTFNYTHYNLNKMRKNLEGKKIQVNGPDSFGNGVVFKNFDDKLKITV